MSYNGVNHKRQAEKKKRDALEKAFPQGIRCQKCLGQGHWSYQCNAKRKCLVRPSRTQIMKQNLKPKKGLDNSEGVPCDSGMSKCGGEFISPFLPDKSSSSSSSSDSDSSSSSESSGSSSSSSSIEDSDSSSEDS